MSRFFSFTFCLLAAGLLSIPTISLAQDNPINKVSIASPTAAALGKYGDIPVNYHTGIPQITIPIYTVSAGSLTLPVSLSYHASGLKVQEPAGWVGAGWALNAGGVITRSVMGGPDERGTNNGGIETNGHFSDYGYNNYLLDAGNHEDWLNFSRGLKDGEPDLYFFNFGKYSGKFYFRDDRTPVIVPEADFRITCTYDETGPSASIQSFTITTPEGVQYSFGNSPGLSGIIPIEKTMPINQNNGLSSANIISSWYLNKITSADGMFPITFTYTAENYGFFTLSMFPVDGVLTSSTSNTKGYELIKNIVQGVRLNTITFPTGSINFVGGAARTDLSDNSTAFLSTDPVNTSSKSLQAIQIMDGTTELRHFQFTYGYFTDNSALPTDLQAANPDLIRDEQRLRLDQVQEISGDGTISKPPYSFTYFSGTVPRRLSFGIDHWGFYNGAANQGLIPTYTVFGTGTSTSYPGANRESNFSYIMDGTLQQINYPTGGYSLFEFGSNNTYITQPVVMNVQLANFFAGYEYGQTALTTHYGFTSDGSTINMVLTNFTSYTANFTITNTSTGAVVYSAGLPNNPYPQSLSVQVPQGAYTANMTCNTNIAPLTYATAVLTQYQTVNVTNTVATGGSCISKITHNDGVTANNMVTTYSYLGDDGKSSGILYSRPVYVGILRNDILKNVGYWTTTGFQQYISMNGCSTVPNALYFKSACSIRPMASTQGNHIGYSQVTVTQSGNGHSVYKYYGSVNIPIGQANAGGISTTAVTVAGCDANQPNFPFPPVPFDYMRGELQYEAHYNEDNQKLKETYYNPVFVQNPVTTPGFIVANQGGQLMATKYELTTSKKTQTQVINNEFDPVTSTSLSTTSTSYNESAFHHEVTRTNTTNSKGEVLETRKKFAFDFRISTCDAIADGYPQYVTNCANYLTSYNSSAVSCAGNNVCLTNNYLAYLANLATARVTYINWRKSNFTNPTNTFQTNHTTAKNAADAELKPVLDLQDNFQNSLIEVTKWKNNNLMNALFSRYDYSTMPVKVYINKVQAINLSSTSPSFTVAATNTGNTSIVKDSRYLDEMVVKFYNGNLAEITAKDGITTSYLYGYNNVLPIAKATGIDQSTLLAAYNTAGQSLTTLRTQPSVSGNLVQLNTYVYSPMIGITSEMDANAKTINYQYDALQRLLTVRDFNNNILKQYDYKFQVLPPNATPQWLATGLTQCKPCPAGITYITNILQQQQKDNNPSSLTYNTLRWVDAGVSSACVVNADWQNTATAIRCQLNGSSQNTGSQEREQKDMNPCSSTYNQTRWIVTGTNLTACPLPVVTCNGSNCTGISNKCVNNACEAGVRINISSVYMKNAQQVFIWRCTYHYQWSDDSISANYTEDNATTCPLGPYNP